MLAQEELYACEGSVKILKPNDTIHFTRNGMKVGELIDELMKFDKELYVVVPTFDISNHEWLNDDIHTVRQNDYFEVELR